jgi:hypothetical protein
VLTGDLETALGQGRRQQPFGDGLEQARASGEVEL